MPRAAAALLLVAALAACRDKAEVTSCDVRLDGAWTTPDDRRWMVLDHGTTLEAYPMFDDSIDGGTPRLIDLERGPTLAGELKRHYLQGTADCIARAPVRVTRCEANTLQLVLGDVTPPLSYAPCSWGSAIPPRVELWRR